MGTPAPRPGTTPTARAAKTAERRKGFRITVRGDTATVMTGEVGPRDDAKFRRATNEALGFKLSLLSALGQLNDNALGLDTICSLHWYFRLRAGDTSMSLDEALDRFPSLNEFEDLVTVEEVVEDDDDEVASPEA